MEVITILLREKEADNELRILANMKRGISKEAKKNSP